MGSTTDLVGRSARALHKYVRHYPADGNRKLLRNITIHQTTRCHIADLSIVITTLLQKQGNVARYAPVSYDKKDGQEGRDLMDTGPVNSLGTRLHPEVQHANKINEDTRQLLSEVQTLASQTVRDTAPNARPVHKHKPSHNEIHAFKCFFFSRYISHALIFICCTH
jgi:hypothetical protein